MGSVPSRAWVGTKPFYQRALALHRVNCPPHLLQSLKCWFGPEAATASGRWGAAMSQGGGWERGRGRRPRDRARLVRASPHVRLTSRALPLLPSVTFLSSTTTALSMHSNSVFGDLKSEEIDLLYSAYGDETGVQCALR